MSLRDITASKTIEGGVMCSGQRDEIRTCVYTADVKPSRGRLGQAAGRHRRRHRTARSAAASRTRAQLRTPELAHQSANRFAHRREDEVELSRFSRPEMAGFALSINACFHLSTEE